MGKQQDMPVAEDGQGNRLAIEPIPQAPPILGADGKPLNQQPTYAISAGVLLIRVLPMRSELNCFGVDPHVVPAILRNLADVYEKQHAEDETHETEVAPEGEGQDG